MSKHVRNTSAAHEAKRRKYAEAVAAMRVPAGFANVHDFLTRGFRSAVEALPLGGAAAMTAELLCDAAAISKWIRGKRLPGPDKYERVLAWYERQQARASGQLPAIMPKAEAPTIIRQAGSRGLTLQRLSPAIQERLNRTAKARNLTPIQFVEQLLDRHLDG